mgnify:CR=1 FL=1
MGCSGLSARLPNASPKGKIPYIVEADLKIGDSTFIREHIEKTYGIDLDRGLTPDMRARSRPGTAMAAMMPMIATTISSSMRVNPVAVRIFIFLRSPSKRKIS